jgi:hypothetical protein
MAPGKVHIAAVSPPATVQTAMLRGSRVPIFSPQADQSYEVIASAAQSQVRGVRLQMLTLW